LIASQLTGVCEGKQVCCWRAWAQAGKVIVRYVASWPKRNGERGKATFPLVYMVKTSFQARCCLSARGIARAKRYNLSKNGQNLLGLVHND